MKIQKEDNYNEDEINNLCGNNQQKKIIFLLL